MSEELLPCPFCGGEAAEEWSGAWEHSKYGAIQDVHIECPGCQAETMNYQGSDNDKSPMLTYEKAGIKAIEAWNKRTTPLIPSDTRHVVMLRGDKGCAKA